MFIISDIVILTPLVGKSLWWNHCQWNASISSSFVLLLKRPDLCCMELGDSGLPWVCNLPHRKSWPSCACFQLWEEKMCIELLIVVDSPQSTCTIKLWLTLASSRREDCWLRAYYCMYLTSLLVQNSNFSTYSTWTLNHRLLQTITLFWPKLTLFES